MSLYETIKQVLIDYAVDGTENQGLHSWRCQYPDSYGHGPCDCFIELVEAVVQAVEKAGRE